MEKRKLGKTNEYLTILGFGGATLWHETPENSALYVATAVNEYGINYFDVAPVYGSAEERLGPALEPYRKSVFLACKTGKYDAEGAEQELQTSLQRLHTDHFDLYQFHSVDKLEDVERIFAPRGSLEVFLKAREKGIIRYIGFSSHNVSAAMAMLEHFDFDTILFPFTWTAWHRGNFGPQVMAKAQEKGVGMMAINAMARGDYPKGAHNPYPNIYYKTVETPEEESLTLRFSLSLPITAALPPSDAEFLRRACTYVDPFVPLSPAEQDELLKRSEGLEPFRKHV
jgi:aryl-alcohol dehydrogenase-like predicted oxidoreductase